MFVKNPVLLQLQRLLGVSPTPTPASIDLGSIDITLPLVPDVARRSMGRGFGYGIMENVHSGADDEESAILVYEAGDLADPPYPGSLDPTANDLWLFGISGWRSSGAGGLTAGSLSMNPGSTSGLQFWGVDDASAFVDGSPDMPVAQFTSISELDGGQNMMIQDDGTAFIKIGMRMPPGLSLVFTSTSAAAAEFQLFVWMGLFPAGMGQDVAS